jgi:hypothetical protein
VKLLLALDSNQLAAVFVAIPKDVNAMLELAATAVQLRIRISQYAGEQYPGLALEILPNLWFGEPYIWKWRHRPSCGCRMPPTNTRQENSKCNIRLYRSMFTRMTKNAGLDRQPIQVSVRRRKTAP